MVRMNNSEGKSVPYKPSPIKIDKKSISIRNLNVGDRFIFTPGLIVEYFQTPALNQTITLCDQGPKKNVKPNTVFLVTYKDAQKIKVKFQFVGVDTQLGKEMVSNEEMTIFFRRVPNLVIDTCYYKKGANFHNQNKIENKTTGRALFQPDRDIARSFRAFSKL